jgi:XTP/dITP diphosphohydrolase
MSAARRFAGGQLVVASHNAGKVREIDDLLRPLGVDAVSAVTLGLAEPEETGDSFRANAELKALAAAKAANLPALADDSGLAVAALGGEPGTYSARWAGPNRDFTLAMSEVWRRLESINVGNYRAQFVSVLTLAWPDGHCESFEGIVQGRVVWPPSGINGFGYDPMFVPHGHDITFGEMEPALKHTISHRAVAFRKLIDACFAAPAGP